MPGLQSDTSNLLLRALSPEDFGHLAFHFDHVGLRHEQVLAVAGERIEHVYFLESGIASIVSTNSDESKTEVGIFGREGLSGLPLLLDVDSSPHQVFMQVDGTTALRIGADAFRATVGKSPSLQALLLRYVQTLFVQSSQSTVANAHNTIEARLSRWLLMCHDRVDGDEIRLTHQFMSMMVAAQRTGVTLTLHTLEGAGTIRAQRGRVTILNRERLEELAGDTYGLAESEYERLIAPFAKRSPPPTVQIARGSLAAS